MRFSRIATVILEDVRKLNCKLNYKRAIVMVLASSLILVIIPCTSE